MNKFSQWKYKRIEGRINRIALYSYNQGKLVDSIDASIYGGENELSEIVLAYLIAERETAKFNILYSQAIISRLFDKQDKLVLNEN